MALTYWIVDRGSNTYGIEPRNHRPSNAIAVAPMEDGKPVADIDWLDIEEIDDGFGGKIKRGVVNKSKKNAKKAQLQVEENRRNDRANKKSSNAAVLKGIKDSDLQSVEDLREAVKKILIHLDLKE